MYKILLVDDDVKNLKATSAFLKSHNYAVQPTSSISDDLKRLEEEEFALVISDYQMPEMLGDEFVSNVRQLNPNQQVLMYSCDLTQNAARNCFKAGALDFISKTAPCDEFIGAVEGFCNKYETALRTIRSSKSKSETRTQIESVGMIGESEAMLKLSKVIQKLAAAKDTSVLIRGESGTGKELVARALHELSPRANYPFVAINCGAIPRDLLESELFGHMKGAFTGANENKEGKFKFANGGTIFLDEIGDMPTELQVKLLRVLQERVVEPVGSRISHKIDVRVISATHKNLDELVNKKLFRDDLIYRLNVVEINVPNLRSRPEDIEPLVEFFTDRINKRNGTKKYFQRQTLEILKGYSWPGNVRELEAMVENHLVMSPEQVIRPENINRKFYESKFASERIKTLEDFKDKKSRELLEFLEESIGLAGGNKSEAARQLEIKDSHLRTLLKDTRSKLEREPPVFSS